MQKLIYNIIQHLHKKVKRVGLLLLYTKLQINRQKTFCARMSFDRILENYFFFSLIYSSFQKRASYLAEMP